MGSWNVNRESIPLLLSIIIPFGLMVIILLYYYGYDITEIFRQIDIIYWIIIIPVALGFTVSLIKKMRPDY